MASRRFLILSRLHPTDTHTQISKRFFDKNFDHRLVESCTCFILIVECEREEKLNEQQEQDMKNESHMCDRSGHTGMTSSYKFNARINGRRFCASVT
jgi:hypothetical protein